MNNLRYGEWTRVNVTTARLLYMMHKTVRIVPCKLTPGNMLIQVDAQCDDRENRYQLDGKDRAGDFGRLVNEFKYYNCNHECGYYPAYYVGGGESK